MCSNGILLFSLCILPLCIVCFVYIVNFKAINRINRDAMNLEYTSNRQHHWHFSSCCDCLVFIMDSSKSSQRNVLATFWNVVLCFLFLIQCLFCFVCSFYFANIELLCQFYLFLVHFFWAFFYVPFLSCHCCTWVAIVVDDALHHSFFSFIHFIVPCFQRLQYENVTLKL